MGWIIFFAFLSLVVIGVILYVMAEQEKARKKKKDKGNSGR